MVSVIYDDQPKILRVTEFGPGIACYLPSCLSSPVSSSGDRPYPAIFLNLRSMSILPIDYC